MNLPKLVASTYWLKEPLTQAQAIVDLYHNPKISIREAAHRWRWDKSKVERFVNDLFVKYALTDRKRDKNETKIEAVISCILVDYKVLTDNLTDKNETENETPRAVNTHLTDTSKPIEPAPVAASIKSKRKNRDKNETPDTISAIYNNIVTNNSIIYTGNEQEQKNQQAAFIKLHEFLLHTTPTVLKMEETFTPAQALEVWRMDREKVKKILLAMHNYKPLLKNNKSAYLTLLNWMRRDDEKAAGRPGQKSYMSAPAIVQPPVYTESLESKLNKYKS
jgi:hypothetical protein